jgi:hypothetical protein
MRFFSGKSCLVIVDVQNCFLPGGSLPVEEGDQVQGDQIGRIFASRAIIYFGQSFFKVQFLGPLFSTV